MSLERQHGIIVKHAASVVEQANRSTTTSVAERKSQLESLVTTIDLRTTDLDQRLSRFTGLLDESLAAAEERARDIARVVAETAGAGSAAISRQFEAVRTAAEEERRQTHDAMSELYQQSSAETDAMFSYISPAQFDLYKEIALQKGFRHVASAPLVRSSYHAADFRPELDG